MSSPRPDVIVLTNVPTPYRLALHQRIDSELPEVRLLTVYTHDVADQAWNLRGGRAEAEGRVLKFGQGDSVTSSSKLESAPREWAKGGRICAWLESLPARPAAMLLCGYNDPGRLRVLWWCARRGVPVFLVGDSNIKGERVSGVKALIKKLVVSRVVRACFGVMPCGSFGGEFFKKYGAAEDRIFYVPYEPDYGLIERLPRATIDRVRRELDLKPERKRVVFCGRFIEAKRPDMAIDAFAAIAGERPDWDLIMIGDGELRAACEARVPEQLRSRVRFTGFIGEQDRISAIYKASDVFVLPSIYEPWGVVINESVCAGMAVVATDSVGAAGELVRDGVNGRTFAPGDVSGLTEALRDATNPAKLDSYQSKSAEVLADWRRRGDPVAGIRAALKAAGVLQ